jgi:nitroreductase
MVFGAQAPVVLVYVADRGRMAKASPEEHALNAHVDSAVIAQNVYLFAASAGLGTVILGSVDRNALAQTLVLRADQIVTFSQPVGYPK